MDRGRIGRRVAGAIGGGCLALGLLAGAALAGTTGKLSGRVTNTRKEPLAGANVIVVGRPLGAATDPDGHFTILNIPSGKVTVKVSLIGHRSVTVRDLEINADNTTRQDVTLAEAAVELQEVVVSARRSVIEVHRTSNIATVSREQLQVLPVQELQDIVNLQAGVVDGHFRGGRIGEVQYQVDGVSVNNAYDNRSTLRLDRSLLEEVQVISGTFDAEYGQAMSGVVNAVLKSGGPKFHWEAEAFSGGPFYPGNEGRIIPDDPRLFSQQNFQASAHGPTPLPSTTFLVSARRYLNHDWIRGERRFNPWDKSRPDSLRLVATGDGEELALGTSREHSGVLKLTNRSIANVELDYQAIANVIDTRRANWSWRLNPDGRTRQHEVSIVQGMDLTHTLTASRFYTLSVRQNYKNYRDLAFASAWDPRYDAWGQPQSFPNNYEFGAIVQGVDLGRFVQKTNGAVFKGAYVDQVTKERQVKLGIEFQAPHIRFGSPDYVYWGVDTTGGNFAPRILRRTGYSPKFPGVVEYRPLIGAAFAQQELEWNDLTIRAGTRFEYFDARASLPSDLANPANSISGVPQSTPRDATAKLSLAPRLGVSYPISTDASLFFAYGHFYQFPGLGQIFESADYDALADLQATSPIRTMGNPDIKPEQTVQYQFGYKHALSDDTGLDVTAFYKDVRDLLGTKIIETYNGAQYAQLSNVDYGSVVGFTVTVTRRPKGLVGATLDYTWQAARGNSSDPNETANRAAAGEDSRPRSIPFNWDQRHTVNLTTVLAKPDQYTVSSVLRLASGQPYTPALTTGFSAGLETNSGSKPFAMVLDLRADKRMSLGELAARGFVRVFNVLDTRYFNGSVFDSSGDPYYSRFPARDEGALADPSRFFGPRRVELGVTLNVSN